MRRFIAYLALSAATVLGVGAAIAPVASNMDTDLAYGDGKTLYFKASQWDTETDNGNYGYGTDHEFLGYYENAAKQPIEYIADTVRARLDTWGVGGYEVVVEGTDTLAVSFRAPRQNETWQMSHIPDLLTFSGGDYDLDAGDTTKEGYSHPDTLTTILDGQSASIVDIDQGGYKVPVVIVPLKAGDDYKTDFLDLISYCKPTSTKVEDDEEDTGIEVRVWANRLEADTNETAATDPNVLRKVVFRLNAKAAVYYDSSDTNKETPYLQIIPESAAFQQDGYHPEETQAAYDAARYTQQLFNSGTFEYDAFMVGNEKVKFNLTYTYSEPCSASVEALLGADDWTRGPTMSRTLIAFVVAMAFLVFGFFLFERALGFIPLVTTALTGFGSFGIFVAFGAQFNIAAVIGLAAASFVGIFSGLFYTSRLKEELYKGRTPKKAAVEAGKRALLPTVDAGVISILIGACLYGFGGEVANKAGLMMTIGGFLGIIIGILVPRILGWLLCNDSTVATSFYKMFNVRKENVPDLLKEEKQTYFGPYADRKFSKGRKWVGIVSLLFLLAGIGSMIGWGVANNGSFYNDASLRETTTSIRIEVRSKSADRIDLSGFSDTGKILDIGYTPDKAPTDIFHTYTINGKTLAEMTKSLTLNDNSVSKVVYIGEGDVQTYYWHYYEAKLNTFLPAFNNGQPKDYTVAMYEGGQYVEQPALSNLSDLAAAIIDNYSPTGGLSNQYNGAYSDQVIITFDDVTANALTPYFYQIAIGTGVGLAIAMLYMILRYRPSRGLAVGLSAGASAFIAASFFCLTRIATSPAVALGGVFIAPLALLLGLFILAAEKEIIRDSKDKDKTSLAFRSKAIEEASSRQAGNLFLIALLALYVTTCFFAFGPTFFASSFLSAIIGLAFAVAIVLCLMPSAAVLFAKGFAHIHLRRIRRGGKKKPAAKKGGQLLKKKSSAEPEEAIFIGIND